MSFQKIDVSIGYGWNATPCSFHFFNPAYCLAVSLIRVEKTISPKDFPEGVEYDKSITSPECTNNRDHRLLSRSKDFSPDLHVKESCFYFHASLYSSID